ncbi:MAG: gamma-glutamyl-phosphate reductase, partial [bacterium]
MNSKLHDDMIAMGDKAIVAAHALSSLNSGTKSAILLAMADELEARSATLKDANASDMKAARAD